MNIFQQEIENQAIDRIQKFSKIADKLGWGRVYSTPQYAYAELIDKVSRIDIWESNPYVFVYDFELVD